MKIILTLILQIQNIESDKLDNFFSTADLKRFSLIGDSSIFWSNFF